MGTDYPFPLGELEPGKLIESMGEFDAETKVCAFSFMILFLNFPDLTVFGFRALWYGIAKDREIVALSIPRTVTWSLEMVDLLKSKGKLKSWKWS